MYISYNPSHPRVTLALHVTHHTMPSFHFTDLRLFCKGKLLMATKYTKLNLCPSWPCNSQTDCVKTSAWSRWVHCMHIQTCITHSIKLELGSILALRMQSGKKQQQNFMVRSDKMLCSLSMHCTVCCCVYAVCAL